MKLIFILVDALKNLYVNNENMPFLSEFCADNICYSSVIPSPGFCERSEIFSGLDCYDSGNFTALGYLPEFSEYKDEKVMLFLMNILEQIHFKGSRILFSQLCKKQKKKMKPYLIPCLGLHNFALTEDGKTKLIAHRDIFDVLSENARSYTLEGFTSLSHNNQIVFSSVLDFVQDSVNKNLEFIPVYIGDIDREGHEFGDDIESMKSVLLKTDQLLKSINDLASESNYLISVLGDHGMVPVSDTIDIAGAVNRLGLRYGVDYLMFLDSTIARFWFYNDKAKERVKNYCDNFLETRGKLITIENCKKHRIPLELLNREGQPVYGDIMWCANPGVLILPDYFHFSNTQVRGMHGYLETDRIHGTGIFTYSARRKHTVEADFYLRDVCKELCSILEIPVPNDAVNWERRPIYE